MLWGARKDGPDDEGGKTRIEVNIMKIKIILILVLMVLLLGEMAGAREFQVSRRYYDDGMLKGFGTNIMLRGTPEHVIKMTRWLDQIAMVPKGYQTLMMISNTPHELVIQHADHVLHSAGRTIAPMTMNLINGVGESVEILFDARTDDRGSHMVYNEKMELIEFSAIQNLYHELAHAMHQMSGTWRYFASEEQAIEEENIFRMELAEIQNMPPTQRFHTKGVMIRDIIPPMPMPATTQ
jgi:hypothetical protein